MAVPRNRTAEAWPLLTAGFRPFFLLAGLWACVGMGIWISMLGGAVELPTLFNPAVWHFHEMLFGFVVAAIAGFLLTAIPNWTGRLPLQGWPLGFLVLLWGLGRLAVAVSAWLGPFIALMVDLAFLIVFTAVVGREILAGRNWRNLPVLAALSVLATANVLVHLGVFRAESFDGAMLAEIGRRLAISTIVMLISLVGGRIIPSFTSNWLRRRRVEKLSAPFGAFDTLTLAVTGGALALWIVFGLGAVSGTSLAVAAALQAARLTRWRGFATISEPLLWILHLGYAWLPFGLAMLSAAAWLPDLFTGAIHSLTAGAMGTMTVAVMTRATLGHSKRELTAGRGTLLVYILVLVAAAARIAAPFLNEGYTTMLEIDGTAWIGGFALFVVLYIPLYVRR